MQRKSQQYNRKSAGGAVRKDSFGEPGVNHKPLSQIVLLAVLLAMVCAIVAATHWPALSAQALSLDDNDYVRENPLIQNPSWSSAGRFITEVLEPSTIAGSYIPLTMISQMLDYAMGGREDNLRPFHRTSLILHLANTALVIVLLYQLLGYAWPAAMAGLLFGIHPLTVDRIAWVTDRKTVLAAFFALWCLILYVRYTRSGGWKAYSVCLLLYLLALLSKPTSLPLPAVFLLFDYWPLRRLNRRTICEKLPFFAIGALSLIIAYVSFACTTPIVTMGEPGAMRIPKVLCHNIIFYLYKIFWPVNLSVFYPFSKPLSVSNPMVLAGVIGSCVLIPALLISLRWTRALLTGWLIFFVAIFPSLGVIGFTDAIAANRFVYLPSIGFLLVLSWALSKLWQRGEINGRLHLRRIATVMLVAILAGLEITSSRSHLVHWRDSESHFRYTLALAPHSAKINYSLGVELARQGKIDEAAMYLSQTLRLNPNFHKAHHNLGIMLAKRGNLDEAVIHFAKAVQFNPADNRARHNLAEALLSKGKIRQAVKHYKDSLRLKPESPYTLNNLSWILATNKNPEFRDGTEAVRLAKQACELTNYKNPEMLDTLSAAYAEISRFAEAVKASQEAVDLCLSSGKQEQAKNIADRQQLYKAGKPYRAD